MYPSILLDREHEIEKYVIMELPKSDAILLSKKFNNGGKKNMAFVLKLQDGTIKEFSSANAATRAFGANSPMNWPSARAFLEKRGIEILEWKSEKNSQGTSRTSGSNAKRLLARLIDDCSRIDKEALKAIRERVNEIFPLAYANEEYQQELLQLSAKMRELKNPRVTLESVLDRVRESWEKYSEEIFSERNGEIGKNENE
jgi:hypothetical protein